jgi:hypothetical protein
VASSEAKGMLLWFHHDQIATVELPDQVAEWLN